MRKENGVSEAKDILIAMRLQENISMAEVTLTHRVATIRLHCRKQL
jgi:hypothetical protein